MKMLRLPRSKVEMGVPLLWNLRDEKGLLLLAVGGIVESEHQLDMLIQRGACVDAKEVRAMARASNLLQTKVLSVYPNMFSLWSQAADELKKLLHHPTQEAQFAQRLHQFALHLIDLVVRNPDLGIYLCVRQESEHHFYYGYKHSLHTALLCTLLARHLHWSAQRSMSLIKAALTMNLTILDLQGEIAGQDIPLRDSQRMVIRAHPMRSVALLRQAGVTDQDWLNAIAQHHEKPDGSGYPLGCTRISELAEALRVTDVFMAKISSRAVRPALSPQEAARQLYREDHGGALSNAIIKEFGIYPPGDFVKLACGELGVAVRRTDNAHAPIVACITDNTGLPVSRTLRRDTGQAEFAIVGTVADKSMLLRLPPERLYGFSVT